MDHSIIPFTLFERGNYVNILSNHLGQRRTAAYQSLTDKVEGLQLGIIDRSGVEPEITIYGQSQAAREKHPLPCLCDQGVHRWGSVTVSTVSFIWTRNARLLKSRDNDIPTE